MKDLAFLTSTIAQLSGATATVWAYTVSHSKLTLRLKRPNVPGNTHIVCGDCQRIEVLPHWLDSKLELVSLGEDRLALIDRRAAVRIECSVIRLQTDVPPVY